MRFNFLLATLLIFLSCQSKIGKENLSVYFDLPSLIKDQIKQFDDLKPEVQKTVDLDGQVESSLLKFDSAGWSGELEIFLEARINKPAFVGAFEEERQDGHVVFTRNDGKDDGVRTFEVHFFADSDDPRVINITSVSSNSLYTSKRELKLEFEKTEGMFRLLGYSIKGTQTILNQDPTEYSVVGKLLY